MESGISLATLDVISQGSQCLQTLGEIFQSRIPESNYQSTVRAETVVLDI